jgi:hypothetical protein
VVNGFSASRGKVICSTDSDPSENETEHFLLGFREDGENIAKLNLTKRRVKPIPIRNPDARVKNNFPTPVPNWIKRVSIV